MISEAASKIQRQWLVHNDKIKQQRQQEEIKKQDMAAREKAASIIQTFLRQHLKASQAGEPEPAKVQDSNEAAPAKESIEPSKGPPEPKEEYFSDDEAFSEFSDTYNPSPSARG